MTEPVVPDVKPTPWWQSIQALLAGILGAGGLFGLLEWLLEQFTAYGHFLPERVRELLGYIAAIIVAILGIRQWKRHSAVAIKASMLAEAAPGVNAKAYDTASRAEAGLPERKEGQTT